MINNLREAIGEKCIQTDVKMSEYTTFRTGGLAKIFITPENIDELKKIIKTLYEIKEPYYVLGNGSNLLVSDRGLTRPVIYIGKALSDINVFENTITALAGSKLSAIAQKALENSLSGFEFASGIPGTLGGAVVMNAGAYDAEMKDVIEAVRFIDPAGDEHIASNDEMEFGYRTTALLNSGCIVLGATISLKNGSKEDIKAKMSELSKRRRDKQPLEFPSAGSTFKRPLGNFAGKLIQDANLKGFSIGGAQVSEKHAGFIINTGNATTENILDLIQHVKNKVYETSNILLEPEIKYWD